MIKQMKLLKYFLDQFFIDIRLDSKHQWELVILSLIVFIYCIVNAIEMFFEQGGPYIDSPDWIKN